MSTRSLNLDDKLYFYYQQHAFRDDEILAELRRVTAEMPESRMQISPEQGAFMTMLVSLLGAKRIVEVGTFTGYSSLCMARALPLNGLLTTMDCSAEWTSIARRFWRKAGVENKVELKLGAAVDSLKQMLDAGHQVSIDLIFIDADKESYMSYLDLGLKLLRPNGVMLFDNVLWAGAVADGNNQQASTVAIRALNDQLLTDSRVEMVMLPLSDGLTIVRKL